MKGEGKGQRGCSLQGVGVYESHRQHGEGKRRLIDVGGRTIGRENDSGKKYINQL